MKNSQKPAVFICILILLAAFAGIILFLESDFYAGAFISIFIALSSFVITFLFLSRSKCMSKMLDGTDLVARWEYSIEETKKNKKFIKEENKGLLPLAFIFFSFAIIVVSLSVGFASENFGIGIIITIVIIILNILFFKIFMSIDKKPNIRGAKETLSLDNKMRYVYISSTGIYAHGLLHVWKGWGSRLVEVRYNQPTRLLSFEYSYLGPRGFGRYTVVVRIPDNEEKSLNSVLDYFVVDVIKLNTRN